METEQAQNQTVADPQLVEAVRKQIEYYFSPENLQNDVFLTQQMDASRSVPLQTVMKFAKLKALTQDEQVVRLALQDSTSVSIIDNNRIRGKAAARSTIILRDVPSDAAEEAVKEIFAFPGAKPYLSVRSEIGDTWFVTFESEQDAKDTLLDLKLKKRTFNGQAVKARMKTETVRAYYTAPLLPQVPVYPMMPFAAPGSFPEMMPYGYMPLVPPMDVLALSDAAAAPAAAAPADVAPTTAAAPAAANSAETKAEDNKTSTAHAAQKDKRSSAAPRPAASSAAGPRGERRPHTGTEGRRPHTEGRTQREGARTHNNNNRGAPGAAPAASSSSAAAAQESKPLEINALTFPPLLSPADDPTPIPNPGYAKDTAVLKYSLDEIIAIVKNVQEASLPSSVRAAEHSLALTAEPNLDLLKRQRTFSIDETREQLRQGRPVLKDAILGGGVDLKSMMYGDNQQHAAVAAASAAQTSAAAAPSLQDPAALVSEKEAVAAPPMESPLLRGGSSSWAALVKSSADVAVSGVSSSSSAVSGARSPVKKTMAKDNTKAAAAAPAPAAPVTTPSQSQKKGDAKSTAKKDKKKEGAESTAAENNDETKSAVAAEPAVAKTWGGKASFANMLKQNLTSEETAAAAELPKKAAPAPAAAAPQTTTTTSKPVKSHDNHNNNNTKREGAKGPKKSEADGKWVKETLPPVSDK